MLYLQSIDAQVEAGDAVGVNDQAEDLLDLRGDLPNPRRIDASELHKLPRAEARTADPHDPGKEIIYTTWRCLVTRSIRTIAPCSIAVE
jgi:hypothetical protein